MTAWGSLLGIRGAQEVRKAKSRGWARGSVVGHRRGPQASTHWALLSPHTRVLDDGRARTHVALQHRGDGLAHHPSPPACPLQALLSPTHPGG